jgi:hypothetical protein
MLAKIQRHGHAEGLEELLLELYQPGEHDRCGRPYLIAKSGGSGNLRSGGSQAGGQDIAQLADWLNEPLARVATPGYRQGVWHCTMRAHPRDRALGDAQWRQIAADILHSTGLAPYGDPRAVRWVVIRHGTSHVHIIATLARQDGTLPYVSSNAALIRNACQDAESRYGLHSTRLDGRAEPPQARLASRARLACLDFPMSPGNSMLAAPSARPPARPGAGPNRSPRPGEHDWCTLLAVQLSGFER